MLAIRLAQAMLDRSTRRQRRSSGKKMLPGAAHATYPRMGQGCRTARASERHGFERLLMLRIYFNFAWQLFLRPLKRLQPEYTPATSKGKQASTAFHVRSA